MGTAKAQISLRIRAVWSGPSLSANKIIGYYKVQNVWTESKGPDDAPRMRKMYCTFWACPKAFLAWCSPPYELEESI